MKLLAKFNIIFLLVFLVGLAGSGLIARGMLQRSAMEDVVDRARLLLEDAGAVSSYTAGQVGPLLETQMKYTFLPQSVPSYSASEVLIALQKSYPGYSFKSAMLNPTNPRNRAVAWEEDVIARFRTAPDVKEYIGQRAAATGMALYIARPIRIANPACLACHSTPEAAPKTLVERYGPSNGMGWKLNEVLGAEVVSVPMTLPLERANQALGVVMAIVAGVLLLMGATLNFLLWKLVIQPVGRLSSLADRVSLGELDAPDFAARSRDEISILAQSIGRMRKSLAHAMKMLDE